MDSTAFEEDRKTYDAVERCLERISEAVTKLGDLAPILMIWDIVQTDLHGFCVALVRTQYAGWRGAKQLYETGRRRLGE